MNTLQDSLGLSGAEGILNTPNEWYHLCVGYDVTMKIASNNKITISFLMTMTINNGELILCAQYSY